MDHKFLGAWMGSLLGAGALGCLGFLWAAPGPPGKPEGDWRLLDAVSYENLAVFPVVSAADADTSGFLTLEDGLASGEVSIREQGSDGIVRNRGDFTPAYRQYQTGASVNQLVLVNRSKRPLLLLAGELVSGGKQDRIIGKDRIVAPGAPPLPLDVFCVEHGRWSSGSSFAAAKIIVHPSVREKAVVDQEQSKVWSAVRSGTTSSVPAGLATPRISMGSLGNAAASVAPTEAYAKLYDSKAVGVPIEGFVAEVQKRFSQATSNLKGERVIGVVVAYGGEVAWSDIFASSSLFEQYWPKLLRSYAVEALARPSLRERAGLEDARDFLRPLRGHETQEVDPGVYRWREITAGPLAQIELDALDPHLITLHRLKLRRTS